MAIHSSILAEPMGLQSMGSQRVRHDWVTEHTWIVDLLCCVSFSCSAKWFSYTHLHESILFKILFAYRLLKVLSRVPSATQFSSVQLLSHVQLFATPWTAACQASLSITKSQSLLKLISIKLVMPSNHLILSSPSSPALNLSQHQDFPQGVSPSHKVAKVLELQLQHQSF